MKIYQSKITKILLRLKRIKEGKKLGKKGIKTEDAREILLSANLYRTPELGAIYRKTRKQHLN